MKSRTILHFLLVVTLLFAGCVSPTKRARIDRAAALIDSLPAEALATLDSVRMGRLTGRLFHRDYRARYALLYTAAQDKNYIDVASDSLIRIATDYYNLGHGTPLDRMQANYYLGRVHYNAGNPLQAMECLMAGAPDVAAAAEIKPYAAGLYYAFMGILHYEYYDFPNALQAYEESLRYFTAAGHQQQIWRMQLHIASVYSSLHRTEEAETLLLPILAELREANETVLLQECVNALIQAYRNWNKYEQLQKLADEGYIAMLPTSVYTLEALATLAAASGDRIRAEQLIDEAEQMAHSATDLAFVYYAKYRMHDLFGEYKEALEQYRIVYHIQDTITLRLFHQPLTIGQRDHYQKEVKVVVRQSRINRIYYALSFVVAALVVWRLFRWWRQRVAARHDAEIGHYIEEMQLIKHRADATAIEMQQQIVQLFGEQFSLIDQLSTIYYETHSLKKDKDAIYNKVQKEIAHWSNQKRNARELEQIVDRYKEGVMSKVREELPTLSELDYQILCYSYAGFSTKAISIFLGTTVSTIDTRRHRLRTKMTQQNLPSAELMLEKLKKVA